MRGLEKALGAICVLCALSLPSFADTLEISASKDLIWDQTKGLYQATGEAQATRGAQAIAADILIAYYDTKAGDQNVTRIIATTNVSFSDTDISGTGANLDYDVARNIYELTGPNARITSKDGKATAQSLLRFERNEGLIIAKDKGEIVLADGRILQGDMIEITLTSSEDIALVSATGNVFMRQQDGKQAAADKGVYDAQTGTAILTGDVKIIDGDSVLNGQKAEIDFNKGISKLLAEEGSGRVSGILSE